MKKNFEDWMTEYDASHQNPRNQKIHKICVPLITLTVVGFFWLVPRPVIFSFQLNWAIVFILACLGFYLTLNFKMFLGMLIQSLVMLWICATLAGRGILLPFCLVVFFFAWLGQFYGHKIEGKKPSFLQDVVFLLIGPLWVLRSLFRKIAL